MRQARGVLPRKSDSVIKDPAAAGTVVLVTLAAGLDRAAVEAWLGLADALFKQVQAATGPDGKRTGTVAVGFGQAFFARLPDVAPPAGFARLPAVPGSADAAVDAAFYVVATREEVVAALMTGLADLPQVAAVRAERGHPRADGTEPFGYKDGVRNVRRDRRPEVVFIDRDVLPEEPAWAQSGTYMAWMKIPQDVKAFSLLPPAEQDAVMGRDRTGRRLDLPAPARDEPDADASALPPTSHVRKAGPRGSGRDGTQIFRRGLPYAEAVGGKVTAGLQFVSFQASLDQLRVVLNRWMLNPDFPIRGCGQDALVARGLVRIESHGFFIVPPDTDGPIGIGMLAPAADPSKARPPKTGKVAIRKRVVDPAGTELDVDLGGFTFQVTDAATGQPVGGPFTTNSHGHALSPDLPVGTPLRLDETAFTPGVTPAQPLPFTLASARLVLRVDNTVPAGTVYGA
jgi:deferrochelatase/peroxidase EfeB